MTDEEDDTKPLEGLSEKEIADRYRGGKAAQPSKSEEDVDTQPRIPKRSRPELEHEPSTVAEPLAEAFDEINAINVLSTLSRTPGDLFLFPGFDPKSRFGRFELSKDPEDRSATRGHLQQLEERLGARIDQMSKSNQAIGVEAGLVVTGGIAGLAGVAIGAIYEAWSILGFGLLFWFTTMYYVVQRR